MFPPKIQDLVIEYWREHGEQIRSYRNLDQHHYNLSCHTFYQIKPKEEFVVYLPDKYTKDFSKLTYEKKIIALDYFTIEFKAFHDFVENMIKSIETNPREFLPAQSLLPLNRLSKYESGELISIMVVGNNATCTRISENNDSKAEAKQLTFFKIPNRVEKIRWDFQ